MTTSRSSSVGSESSRSHMTGSAIADCGSATKVIDIPIFLGAPNHSSALPKIKRRMGAAIATNVSRGLAAPTRGEFETYNERFLENGLENAALILAKSWRPRPESNRGARICSPLRHHSATWPSARRRRSPTGRRRVSYGRTLESTRVAAKNTLHRPRDRTTRRDFPRPRLSSPSTRTSSIPRGTRWSTPPRSASTWSKARS